MSFFITQTNAARVDVVDQEILPAAEFYLPETHES